MNIVYNIDNKIVRKDTKTIKDLINEPIIIRVTEFDEEPAKEFSEKMSEAQNTDQNIIPVIIDSYGGYVDALMSMVSDIKHSKKPVATICVGKAMSCGALLLSFGATGFRFADPDSRIMVHDISNMTWGKAYDMKSDSDETVRLHKKLYRMMAQNCGQTEDYFLDLMHDNHHSNVYMDVDTAVKHKIIDRTHVPQFNIDINVEINLI